MFDSKLSVIPLPNIWESVELKIPLNDAEVIVLLPPLMITERVEAFTVEDIVLSSLANNSPLTVKSSALEAVEAFELLKA